MNEWDDQDMVERGKGVKPTEYFCIGCLQLRLSLRVVDACCGNCGSDRIIKGEVGTLDKQALLKQYRGK